MSQFLLIQALALECTGNEDRKPSASFNAPGDGNDGKNQHYYTV